MLGDKLKDLIKKDDKEQVGNNKKKIENLVFFVVVLIITIVMINLIWNGKKKKTKDEDETVYKHLAAKHENNNLINENTVQEAESLDKQLENILSKIQGVGEVQVFINYSETSEVVAMYNETTKTSSTEENDTSGGTRKIQETDSQKDIIYQEENGEKMPITRKVIKPKIEGAIITAKGAASAEIKASIVQAVEAVTGLATHKIQVFEMK